MNTGIFSEWIKNFPEWYREAGELRIFWAKPLISITVEESNDPYIYLIEWRTRKGPETSVIGISPEWNFREACQELEKYKCIKIVILPENSPPIPDRISARGILYLWNTEIIPPVTCPVEVEIREKWREEELRIVEEIQKMSWGFFKKPLERDVILIAKMDDKKVGTAYLNSINFNLDYGVHVRRDMWRKGIGRCLMNVALSYAGERSPYLSVVRIFRSLNGTSADRRAVDFYSACNPSKKFSVYRIR